MSAPVSGTTGRPALRTLAAVAGAFVGTAMLIGPAQVYYANSSEFAHQLSRGWPLQCAAALAAFVLLLASLRWAVPERQSQAAAALVVGLAGLLWVQGAFFSGDIGRLDGAPKSWNLGLAAGSTLAWLCVLAAAYGARRQLTPHLSFIAIALVLAQVLGLAATVINAVPRKAQPYRLEPRDAFTYSRSGNVVILVVDSATSSLFRDLLLEPKTSGEFDGFTFYADALGGYPTTVASVPLILSGRYYDNSVPLDQFWAEIAPHLVSTRLRSVGYQAYIQPIDLLPATPAIADNVVPNSFDSRDWRRLGLLTTFRMLPSPLRIALYDRTSLINTPQNVATTAPDLLFLRGFERNWRVIDGPRQFKYHHLFGMHLPYSLDEQLNEAVVREGTWASARRQARAEIEILRRWLQRLRNDDVYDNSFLVILGDHGSPPLRGEPAGAAATPGMEAPDGSGMPIPFATPLLLVKPIGAHGALRMSPVAATLADVSASVLAAAGLPPDGGAGKPLAELDSATQRVRSYYHYGWDGDWSRANLPNMVEFEVRGPAHDASSWRRTGRILMSGKASIAPAYAYGTTLEAVADGRLAECCTAGFSGPESGIMWTSAPTARCVLPMALPPAGAGLRLALDVLPHVGPGLDRQVVQVTANGVDVGTWTISDPGVIRAFLPPDLVERELRLGLALPNARAPLELGTSQDPRHLGVAVRSLRVDPVLPANNATPLAAGQGGAALPYLGDGWATPEPGLTWTDGPVATIDLQITPPPPGLTVRLTLTLHPFVQLGLDRQVVRATANGVDIGKWTLSKAQELQVDLPSRIVRSEVRLVLHLPSARSPKELGGGQDPRRLGVALTSLRIDPVAPARPDALLSGRP